MEAITQKIRMCAVLAATAVGLWAIAPRAQAQQALIYDCNGCTNAQINTELQRRIQSLPTPSTVNIYFVNTTQSFAKKYYVNKQFVNEGGGPHCNVVPPPPITPIECTVSAFPVPKPVEPIISDYIALKQQLESQPLPSGANLPDSAYTEILYPDYRTNVGAYLLNQTTEGDVQWLLNGLATIGYSASLVINVRYPDGSVSRYQWDSSKRTFVVVPNSYRDKANNRIPTTRDEIVGSDSGSVVFDFTFNSDNMDDFIYQLQLLGVPITGPGSSRRLACTSTTGPNGERYVNCRWI